MQDRYIREFRRLAEERHETDWRLASIIATNVVVLGRGQQPAKPKVSADEFATTVDVRGWSRQTVVRWWRAWELAADDAIVPHAADIQVSKGARNEAIEAAKKFLFEDYLAAVIKAERGDVELEADAEVDAESTGFLTDEEAEARAEDALDEVYDPIHWERTIQRLEKGLVGLEDWWMENDEAFSRGELRDNMGGEAEAAQRVVEASERALTMANVFRTAITTMPPKPPTKVSKRPTLKAVDDALDVIRGDQ